jgi:ribosomal protein L16/L10AE
VRRRARAEREGTYRIVLEALRGGPAHALALRDFCGGPDWSAELACQVTAPALESSRAELTRALREGERVMIVGMATGGLRYRIAVTVP